MTTYVEDDNGGLVSEACVYFCTPGVPAAACEGLECQCGCHRSSEPWVDPDLADRARELGDRPAAALENLARDMEAEARPDVAELVAERFGQVRRGT